MTPPKDVIGYAVFVVEKTGFQPRYQTEEDGGGRFYIYPTLKEAKNATSGFSDESVVKVTIRAKK